MEQLTISDHFIYIRYVTILFLLELVQINLRLQWHSSNQPFVNLINYKYIFVLVPSPLVEEVIKYLVEQ
jgi:hypothetical protein